ncbi:MAG TPA: hypothetical protein VIV11_24765 [Kofleriaceae bacterium]
MFKTRLFGIMALALTGALFTACDDDDEFVDDVIDERIDELDLDDDLLVTRVEWADAFLVWDGDNDLLIGVNEFRFNGGGFELADVNNDGYVTDEEWDDLMDVWDIDDDAVLEELEFEPYL